jgi:hypothetical protein
MSTMKRSPFDGGTAGDGPDINLQQQQARMHRALIARRVCTLRSHEDHKPSFWRRLFERIMQARQKKADQYVAEFLRRHEEYQQE